MFSVLLYQKVTIQEFLVNFCVSIQVPLYPSHGSEVCLVKHECIVTHFVNHLPYRGKSMNSAPWKPPISIKDSTKSVYIMQKYVGFFYSGSGHFESAQCWPPGGGRGGGGGGGGGGEVEVLPSLFFYSSWSKVFVAKAPTFYPEVHFSSTKGLD